MIESPLSKLSVSSATWPASKSPRTQIYLSMAIFAVTTLVFLLIFAGNFPLAIRIPIAAVVGIVLPIIQLKNQAAKRLTGINDQFPDTLELIVRSLRVGHPIGTALQTVAREIPAPTGPEFELIARQVTYGKTPAEAVGLADRGEIAAGRRADLIRVNVASSVPVVRSVWRQGRRVA